MQGHVLHINLSTTPSCSTLASAAAALELQPGVHVWLCSITCGPAAWRGQRRMTARDQSANGGMGALQRRLEEARLQGNQAYKAGEDAQALKLYSSGINEALEAGAADFSGAPADGDEVQQV